MSKSQASSFWAREMPQQWNNRLCSQLFFPFKPKISSKRFRVGDLPLVLSSFSPSGRSRTQGRSPSGPLEPETSPSSLVVWDPAFRTLAGNPGHIPVAKGQSSLFYAPSHRCLSGTSTFFLSTIIDAIQRLWSMSSGKILKNFTKGNECH